MPPDPPAPSSGGSPPRGDDAWPLDDHLHEVMVGIGLGEPGPTIEEKLRALAEAVITLDEATGSLRALVGAGDEPEMECMHCDCWHSKSERCCFCDPPAPVQGTPEGDAASEPKGEKVRYYRGLVVEADDVFKTLHGEIEGVESPADYVRWLSEKRFVPKRGERYLLEGGAEMEAREDHGETYCTAILGAPCRGHRIDPRSPPAAGTTPPADFAASLVATPADVWCQSCGVKFSRPAGDGCNAPTEHAAAPAVPPPGDAATERLAQMREVVQAACVERDAAVERATRLEEGLRERCEWVGQQMFGESATEWEEGWRKGAAEVLRPLGALLTSAAPTPTEGDSDDG